MAFIFVLFLFPDFVKAETIDINSYSEIKRLEEKLPLIHQKFFEENPKNKVSIQEKNFCKRNPFLPFDKIW